MLFYSSTASTVILVSTMAILSSSTFAPAVEAHSWMDCVDWRFNSGSKDYSNHGGHCNGYARRFPLGKAFGSLDHASPSRHYQQAGNPNTALPCSDGHHGKDVGSDETQGRPIASAYGGKWGSMTVTKAGSQLCIRWPAKNHAEKNEDNTVVQINFMKNTIGRDPTQQQLLKNTIAKLPYKNCGSGPSDTRPCGGCFNVPSDANGMYLLQWRWMLNPGEWYTSCADVQVGGGSDISSRTAAGVTSTVNTLVKSVGKFGKGKTESKGKKGGKGKGKGKGKGRKH